jgi:hypothetical protein
MNIKLTHYSKTPVETLDYFKKYIIEIDAALLPTSFKKPVGLWVSVDEEYGWKEWCLIEGFRLESLSYKYEVVLKSNANVIILTTKEEIIDFSAKYFKKGEYWFDSKLDWAKVKETYQGIIITPYQDGLDEEYSWYYGWDCASGCIWDVSCIKEFNLIEHKIYK